ncbi:hypothetical protein IKF40_02515 [Candidatus Saccharibacteria bacterium]|nr:hypothetical protein [Candidatus Saccharibacteria bacterium]
MFFDDPAQIPELAAKSGFSIFAIKDTVGETVKFPSKNILEVKPDPQTGKITIEKIREIIDFCKVEQKNPFYIIIRNAEKLNEFAENALLKLLEEPAKNYHFVLFTNNTSALLETILSRGDIYILRSQNILEKSVNAPSNDYRAYAKQLITAKPADLLSLAETITKDTKIKKNLRENVLIIIGIAIETLYKSYFKTGNLSFIAKLPNFLTLEENIRKNGHIKLHIVADLC